MSVVGDGNSNAERVLARRHQGVSFLFACFTAGLLMMPLVGHGCHGDDVDHEPSAPPSQFQPEDPR